VKLSRVEVKTSAPGNAACMRWKMSRTCTAS